jgi:hypothetical protein
LYNRKQRVVLQFHNSTTFVSEWETSRHGVHQGSVLGPLLFNVYINDFPSILNNVAHTILYADDITIIVSSNDLNPLNYKLNIVMNRISKWFQNNHLVLNLKTTHMIQFTTAKAHEYPLHIVYNNQDLNIDENVKFLCMHLDCHLNWKQHSDNLVKKLSTACFMLRKLQFIVSEQMLRMVYFAHFQSQLGYGIIFWGSSSSMISIFAVQKRAIGIMLRLGPRSSCREGFKKMDILTVPCLYIYALMTFVVKNHNIYQTNNSIHNLNTRQQEKLHVSSVRLFSIQRGVHYSSIRIFNNLPQSIHILKDNVNTFKQRLKNFLISNAFYSIDEYIFYICMITEDLHCV